MCVLYAFSLSSPARMCILDSFYCFLMLPKEAFLYEQSQFNSIYIQADVLQNFQHFLSRHNFCYLYD